MSEFFIKYSDGKLSVIVNGQELVNPRHVEIVLPVYADGYVKIGQRIGEPGSIEQSIMTVITNIDSMDIIGSLKSE